MKQIIDIVYCKAKSELKAENSRNYAGFLWWFFEPFMALVVYFVVFKCFLNIPRDIMGLFLGLITFRWFSSSLARASDSMTDGRRIMLQVYLNKTIFPLATIAVNTFKYSLVLILAISIALITGQSDFYLSWITLPIIFALSILLLSGCAFIVSGLTPFLPDMNLMIGTILQLFMWMSCVFYTLEDLPAKYQLILRINPVAVVVNEIRNILLWGRWPSWELYPALVLQTVVTVLIGYWLLSKYDRVYPKMTF